MAQRKGSLPVVDSRSSEERDQEDQDVMAAVMMVRGPMCPPALGILFLTWLREPKKVSLNWSLHPEPIREPNSVEGKPLLGQGNIPCKSFQWV